MMSCLKTSLKSVVKDVMVKYDVIQCNGWHCIMMSC